MDGRSVLLTGFGAFEEVSDNPSGALARALDGERLVAGNPSGEVTGRVIGQVTGQIIGAVLPVSFQRVGPELEALVERIQPDVIVSLGVHPGAGFRIERGAGPTLAPGRPDMDGVDAASLPHKDGERLETDLDLAPLAGALERGSGAGVALSDDAGRYVCEGTYRCVLEIGARRGTPGLFVHVPPVEELGLEAQRQGMRELLVGVLEQVGVRGG